MSRNWGRTPISNADKRTPQTRYLVETDDGTEERIDRRPQGKVEKFVDKAGHVVSLQIYADGDTKRAETEIRMRAQYHKKGLIELSKCPVKHGHKQFALKDFRNMPAHLEGECKHDPKIMERRDGDLYAKQGCPHIEWLIEFRRQQDAEAYAKRNAHVAAADAARKREAVIKELQLKKLAADLGIEGDDGAAVEQAVAERKPRRRKAQEVAPE